MFSSKKMVVGKKLGETPIGIPFTEVLAHKNTNNVNEILLPVYKVRRKQMRKKIMKYLAFDIENFIVVGNKMEYRENEQLIQYV